MRADMRFVVTFKSRGEAQNGYGEELTWNNVISCFASFEPILGNEYYAAERADSKVEAKIRCWYFDGVTNEMRVNHLGQDYEILSAVNWKNLNREWLIYVRKVAD